jgi:hypothetical protein
LREKERDFSFGFENFNRPPLTDEWAEGLHPYKPVIKDGKLYGRGGADDGYGTYCAVTGKRFVCLLDNRHFSGHVR